MRIELNHDQRKRLIDALHTAYNKGSIEAMLDEHLGRRLDDAVDLPQPWSTLPTSLQRRAYMESWNDDLILASAAAAPRDAALARLVMELGLSAAGPGRLSVSASVVAQDAQLASLEGLVKKASQLQDVAAFIAALTQLQYQVCRVEIGNGPPSPLGTGFLVGEDLVLTNWHVAEAIQQMDPAQARCRFDYRADAAGLEVQAGFAVPLVDDWLVTSRPYAGSDIERGGTPPTATDLDYALLRMTKPVANFAPNKEAQLASAPPRGFLKLNEEVPLPKVKAELFVLQHPSGLPMKLAVGQVTGRTPDSAAALRLQHDSTTEGGSSGSPCFNADLKLVALHHATDPKNPEKPLFNQGIPIGLIYNDLRAGGFLH